MKMKKTKAIYNLQVSRKPRIKYKIMNNINYQESKTMFQKVSFKVTLFKTKLIKIIVYKTIIV